MHKGHWKNSEVKKSGRPYASYLRPWEKVRKSQDADGLTQTPVSWTAPSNPLPSPLPPSPCGVETPTVGVPAAALACYSAALQLSTSCYFCMNAFPPSRRASTPSAGLLCSLQPPFKCHAKSRHTFPQVHHPILRLPPWENLTHSQLPKGHHSWQKLHPHTCHEHRAQHLSSVSTQSAQLLE